MVASLWSTVCIVCACTLDHLVAPHPALWEELPCTLSSALLDSAFGT